MKSAISTMAFLGLCFFVFISCEKKEEKENPQPTSTPLAKGTGGELTFGDTTYSVNPYAIVINWGEDDGGGSSLVHSGYEMEISIYENTMIITPNPRWADLNGKGRGVGLTVYSSSGQSLDEGVYTYVPYAPYPLGSFGSAGTFTKTITNNSFHWGSGLLITGGTFEVTHIENNLYDITLNLVGENWSTGNDSVPITADINVGLVINEY